MVGTRLPGYPAFLAAADFQAAFSGCVGRKAGRLATITTLPLPGWSMAREHIHFVTGRLAEHSLRRVVEPLARELGFDYSLGVMKITVAALLTTQWIRPRLEPPPGATRVILPGYCRGDLEPLVKAFGVPVERGPKDLRQLPEYFGRQPPQEYGTFDIEILAEINHAPRLTLHEILAEAARLKAAGADVIDLGCDPGSVWQGVGEAVRALVAEGHRVSIDSFEPREIAAAVAAGAELVLSVNHTNRHAAPDWGAEVVVIPDEPGTLTGLEDTVEQLAAAGVPLRVDPILEPIGFGFAESLGRYLEVRRRMPDVEMMMGIGNLTELTEVDSAGVNMLLVGFCQEQGIRSVLTTEVINWCRSSVAECDVARRLAWYAVRQRSLPKHIDRRIVMLRDARVPEVPPEELDALAASIKDPNYRLFVSQGQLHLVSAGMHLADADPYALFHALLAREPKNVDAAHAFYLGYEMAKAVTALTLGKEYRQDEALNWGLLTREEVSHHEKKSADFRASGGEACE